MTRENVETLRRFVLTQTALLERPGKLLYSSGETLAPHEIYFLGTKPGGTLPDTIRQSLDHLDDGRNEYLDYSWEGRPPGEQKLQKQVRRFLGGLGYDIRSVPASNIVLTRERSITTHPSLDQDAELCWPIHKLILSMVQPKAIVAFGSGEEKSPFAYLHRFLAPSKIDTIHSGQGNFFCHRFQATLDGHVLNVVIVPHLTRYSPYKRPDIMQWAKEGISTSCK